MKDLDYKRIEVPDKVEYIIEVLEKNGFKAYMVGGCVRDSLCDIVPHDYDITTSALPEDVINLFDKTIPTGLKHGTVTVVIEGEMFEVTTFRVDGEYLDSRRPEEVIFVKDLREDLSRRDFTINAMAYNNSEGLQDFFDGEVDLENSIIRTVGDPHKRFEEDALRMMRAVRFSAQLGFSIHKDTLEAIEDLNYLIDNISVERIREEVNKILLSDSNCIELLLQLGLLERFMPEVVACNGCLQNNPYHIYDVFKHTLVATKFIKPVLYLKLTMLFHDIGKVPCKTTDENGIDHFYHHPKESCDMARDIMKRLKYDNKTIDKVLILIKYHDITLNSKKSIRKLLTKISKEDFEDLLLVKEADMRAHNPKYLDESLEKIKIIRGKYLEILEEANCLSLKDLAIDGRFLIEKGYASQGKEIGMLLNYLLDRVIEEPEKNNVYNLTEYINEYKNK